MDDSAIGVVLDCLESATAVDDFVGHCCPFCIVSGIVIARLPLQTVGIVLIGLFCLTASWDQVSIVGIRGRMLLLLLLGLLLLALYDMA